MQTKHLSLSVKVVRLLGHLYCGMIGVASNFITGLIEKAARQLMNLAESLTGTTDTKPQFPKAIVSVAPVHEKSHKDFIDEDSTRQLSTFPIKESDLIDKCKEVIKFQFGCQKPGLLADEFLFIFPVVGPLSKEDFIEIFSSFKMESGLTGSANYYNFFVDPLEPNRVWFFSRSILKHTGDLIFGPQKMKASGTTIENPPQVLSMSFTTEGLCYKFTGGYSVDRTVGNTGGLGGLFGILHALGNTLPFPEGQPWKPSVAMEAFTNHFPNLEKVWKSA